MFIELYTRDDGFVAGAQIPDFEGLPEVILWGSRVFVRYRDDNDELEYLDPGDAARYTEAFTYAIP